MKPRKKFKVFYSSVDGGGIAIVKAKHKKDIPRVLSQSDNKKIIRIEFIN